MKKALLLAMSMVLFGFSFIACGSKKESNETVTQESVDDTQTQEELQETTSETSKS
jgi:hypothetical protein